MQGFSPKALEAWVHLKAAYETLNQEAPGLISPLDLDISGITLPSQEITTLTSNMGSVAEDNNKVCKICTSGIEAPHPDCANSPEQSLSFVSEMVNMMAKGKVNYKELENIEGEQLLELEYKDESSANNTAEDKNQPQNVQMNQTETVHINQMEILDKQQVLPLEDDSSKQVKGWTSSVKLRASFVQQTDNSTVNRHESLCTNIVYEKPSSFDVPFGNGVELNQAFIETSPAELLEMPYIGTDDEGIISITPVSSSITANPLPFKVQVLSPPVITVNNLGTRYRKMTTEEKVECFRTTSPTDEVVVLKMNSGKRNSKKPYGRELFKLLGREPVEEELDEARNMLAKYQVKHELGRQIIRPRLKRRSSGKKVDVKVERTDTDDTGETYSSNKSTPLNEQKRKRKSSSSVSRHNRMKVIGSSEESETPTSPGFVYLNDRRSSYPFRNTSWRAKRAEALSCSNQNTQTTEKADKSTVVDIERPNLVSNCETNTPVYRYSTLKSPMLNLVGSKSTPKKKSHKTDTEYSTENDIPRKHKKSQKKPRIIVEDSSSSVYTSDNSPGFSSVKRKGRRSFVKTQNVTVSQPKDNLAVTFAGKSSEKSPPLSNNVRNSVKRRETPFKKYIDWGPDGSDLGLSKKRTGNEESDDINANLQLVKQKVAQTSINFGKSSSGENSYGTARQSSSSSSVYFSPLNKQPENQDSHEKVPENQSGSQKKNPHHHTAIKNPIVTKPSDDNNLDGESNRSRRESHKGFFKSPPTRGMMDTLNNLDELLETYKNIPSLTRQGTPIRGLDSLNGTPARDSDKATDDKPVRERLESVEKFKDVPTLTRQRGILAGRDMCGENPGESNKTMPAGSRKATPATDRVLNRTRQQTAVEREKQAETTVDEEETENVSSVIMHGATPVRSGISGKVGGHLGNTGTPMSRNMKAHIWDQRLATDKRFKNVSSVTCTPLSINKLGESPGCYDDDIVGASPILRNAQRGGYRQVKGITPISSHLKPTSLAMTSSPIKTPGSKKIPKSGKRRGQIISQSRRKLVDDGCSPVVMDAEKMFPLGTVVWARLGLQRYWPGLVITGSLCGQPPAKEHWNWVYWFGDHKVSMVKVDKTLEFSTNFNNKVTSNGSQIYNKALREAISLCGGRAGLDLTNNSSEECLKWASDGFLFEGVHHYEKFMPSEESAIPSTIQMNLDRIRSQNFTSASDSAPSPERLVTENQLGVLHIKEGLHYFIASILCLNQYTTAIHWIQQQKLTFEITDVEELTFLYSLHLDKHLTVHEINLDLKDLFAITAEGLYAFKKQIPVFLKNCLQPCTVLVSPINIAVLFNGQAISKGTRELLVELIGDSVYLEMIPDTRIYRRSFQGELQKAREGKMKIEDVCIACDKAKPVVCQHPLFHGGLCSKCKSNVQDTLFTVDEEGIYSFCVVCGNGGRLFVCDDCNRVYCIGCVKTVVSSEAVNYVRDSDPWICYFCTSPNTPGYDHGLFKAKDNWERNILHMFMPEDMDTIVPSKRPTGIRVLSLFDGICSGKVALQQLGIKVEAYFSSEIDVNCLKVTEVRHNDGKVSQLGDVNNITISDLKKILPIDLVIGGSPCNEFSIANPWRKGMEGGTGLLFFEYYRILSQIRMLSKDSHVFWLYENVSSMQAEVKQKMSTFFGSDPVMIDARVFSAQTRKRYFWGNIPGLYCPPQVITKSQRQDLSSSLLGQRTAKVSSVRTVTTRTNSLMQGKNEDSYPVKTSDGTGDTLWIPELEKLFGLEPHYTDVANLPATKRQVLIGKGWSIPVIKHILAPLKNFYEVEK